MATFKAVYSAITTVSVTYAGLANAAALVTGRKSALQNNTSNLYVDAYLGGRITTGATPPGSRQIEIWLAGSPDNNIFSAAVCGGEGAHHVTTDKGSLKLGAIVSCGAEANKVKEFTVDSVAAVFGGVMPPYWTVFITHNTSAALHATTSNHSLRYVGVQYQSV